MNYKNLRQEVFEANIELVKQNLVIYTWGNVSAYDKKNGLIAIKPSGVSYETMKPEHMVIINIEGEIVDGNFKPSSDTPTHLEIYRNFPEIEGVVHTHSTYATSWAQAGLPIPALGTTHADYFYGEIPCTRELTNNEVEEEYELNTGKVIVETFNSINPKHVPGVIVKNHGPFSWGKNAFDAVHNAKVMEETAKMAFITLSLNNKAKFPDYLKTKHFMRKHGDNASYGQK